MEAEQTHTISQVGGSTAHEPVSKNSVGSAVAGYNMRCPAVKRLMREAAELATPESDFAAHPTEANLFEWHFTIRGPEESEFERGVYHGRIIFPTDYPMKPPSFILLTPNGRFQTEEKICLSISNYHPETWLPSWSIRTALVALRSFMTAPGNEGAIGSLNFSPEERKKLALKSQTWACHECGPIIKLLPGKHAETSTANKGNEDCSSSPTNVSPTVSSSSKPQSDASADQKNATTTSNVPTTDSCANGTAYETATPINSTADAENRDATALSSESAAATQQQQQNEPIKNIIYDFGIGCFVVLILALCLRRLQALFLRL